eukprot:scaffold69413_cov40-Cyclotella_meneghiniana.AAC.1
MINVYVGVHGSRVQASLSVSRSYFKLYYLTPKGVRIFDTPSREDSADLGNYRAEHWWMFVHFARCSK